MGLVDELQGVRVCIDTAPIIYFIEKNPKYLGVLKPVFLEIDTERIEAITSTITLLEVLVHPFRTKNDILAEKYRDILLYSEGQRREFHWANKPNEPNKPKQPNKLK